VLQLSTDEYVLTEGYRTCAERNIHEERRLTQSELVEELEEICDSHQRDQTSLDQIRTHTKGGEPLSRDLDLGQVLAIQPTAEEERKVLWKLDLSAVGWIAST
jgi:hypothetical protein